MTSEGLQPPKPLQIGFAALGLFDIYHRLFTDWEVVIHLTREISDTGLESIRALNCLNNFDKGTVTGIKAGKFRNLRSIQI